MKRLFQWLNKPADSPEIWIFFCVVLLVAWATLA